MSAALSIPPRPPREPSPLTGADYQRYAPLVKRIAMYVARRVPRHVLMSDLIAYGWLGLLEAHNRAGTMTEEEFEAFAAPRVRGAMLDHLRSLDTLSRRARSKSRDLSRAIRELTHTLGRAPEEREIAERLGLDAASYEKLLQDIAEAGMAQLEVVDFDLGDEAEPMDDTVNRKLLVETVAREIQKLPQRLQYVVALRHKEDCTLAQIGEILGVTEARACQLHSEAMHRLRAAIGSA